MYTYKILKKIENKEWNNNLLKCEYSTFFQSAEYLIQKDTNKFPLFVYVYDSNGEIKGQLGLTVIKTKKGYSTDSLKKVVEVASKLGNRGTWVSGPIIHSNNEKTRIQILNTFLIALDKISEDFDLMILDGYSPPQDICVTDDYKNQFKNYGYTIQKFTTFVTDLSNEIESIWKNVKKNARNDVTKAEREKITAITIQNKNELKNYELLFNKWVKTKGIKESDPLENLENDWKFYEANIEKYFLAKKDTEILAGLRLGCFNKIVYTHQVLNSYSKTGNVAGPFLTWFAIKWAKENGMRLYDFSGGEAPSEKLSDKKRYSEQWDNLLTYKKKWGGNEYPYFHFIKIKNKKKYKLFRLLSKPDWMLRNYKKKHYKRPR